MHPSLLLAALAVSCGPATSPAWEPPPVPPAKVTGVVTWTAGSTRSQAATGAPWRELGAGDAVSIGSRYVADAGRADLLLAESAVLRLLPGSGVLVRDNIEEAGARRIDVKIETGAVLNVVGALPPGSEYRLTAAAAGVTAKGRAGFQASAIGDELTVLVFDGQVDMSAGGGQVRVSEGESARVVRGAPPEAPRPITRREARHREERTSVHFSPEPADGTRTGRD